MSYKSSKSGRSRECSEKKWICDNEYCTEEFETEVELEFHQLADHKEKISNTLKRGNSLQFKDVVSSVMKQKKHVSIKERLRSIFTSEGRRLENESPPVENIRFQYYSPRSNEIARNGGTASRSRSKATEPVKTTSPSVPKTYASLRQSVKSDKNVQNVQNVQKVHHDSTEEFSPKSPKVI